MADPTSLDLLRAVLDPVRLATLGAAVHANVSIEELSDRLGVEPRTIAEAIGSLRSAGLMHNDASIDRDALRSIARELPKREPGLGEPVAGPWTSQEAEILGRFFAAGRLVEIPASAHKRALVLEKIVQEFDPGVRYLERDVNFTIQFVHADYAAIRRYLVDGGFLARADGVYWRTGGRYVTIEEPPNGTETTTSSVVSTDRDDVVLQPWETSMADRLVVAANDREIARYMRDSFPQPYTADDAGHWLAIARDEIPVMNYAVVFEDELVGGVGGTALEAEETGVVEISWWLNPHYWGRGITTAAVRALIDEMFTRSGVERLWATVMAPDVGSCRVAEKAGMHLEGVASLHYLKAGVRHDRLNYGLIRSGWAQGTTGPRDR